MSEFEKAKAGRPRTKAPMEGPKAVPRAPRAGQTGNPKYSRRRYRR